MTITDSIYQRFRKFSSLQTDRIGMLPIVILMPHSACNCQCVMCDIWKDNRNLKQLTEKDISGLLESLKRLGTEQVLMSGGEALLNPTFFMFCKILQSHGMRISLLSTGLTLQRHAAGLLQWVNDIIISLDGDEDVHNRIRNIPNAFQKLREGVQYIKKIRPEFRITGRTVIQRLNFRHWPSIIECGREMGLDQVSFLPADTSSHAFNREILWSDQRQQEILPAENEIAELKEIIEQLIQNKKADFSSRFIAESPDKLRLIHTYYSAVYGQQPFPYKKCNAPWVSAVVEPDGTVRPCFFHGPMGNIREQSLENILNSKEGIRFRKKLNINRDPVCSRCVCYLHYQGPAKQASIHTTG